MLTTWTVVITQASDGSDGYSSHIRYDQSSPVASCNRAASLSVLTAGWQERRDRQARPSAVTALTTESGAADTRTSKTPPAISLTLFHRRFTLADALPTPRIVVLHQPCPNTEQALT